MDKKDLKEIIEKGVIKYRSRMEGSELEPPLSHRLASADVIRHFADGIGDRNPLWRDFDYAVSSVHGGLLAPPLFLNAVSEGQAFPGLPGLVATFVGSEWEWFRLIREGESFTAVNRLLPLEDKSKGDGLAKYLQSGLITYLDRQGHRVGTCTWRVLRSELPPGRLKIGNKGDKPDPKPHRYTEQEIDRIYQDLDAEEIRGDIPRFFEEVTPGEKVVPVVKGPLAISDMVAWAIGVGWHRLSLAHESKLAFLRSNPGLSYRDQNTGFPEPIGNSHLIPEAAGILMGSRLPLDVGLQRVCWMGHPVTNWMGDRGFLRSLSTRISGLVRFGDTVWCKGLVAWKQLQDGHGLVDIDLEAVNQLGRIVAGGRARVELPLRGEV